MEQPVRQARREFLESLDRQAQQAQRERRVHLAQPEPLELRELQGRLDLRDRKDRLASPARLVLLEQLARQEQWAPQDRMALQARRAQPDQPVNRSFLSAHGISIRIMQSARRFRCPDRVTFRSSTATLCTSRILTAEFTGRSWPRLAQREQLERMAQ
jgi:hypothetical protein